MLESYFKIAWRNLIKTKGYSLINIGGLAVGMAVAMLIGLWIYDELAFDTYHQNYSSIAEVMRRGEFQGQKYVSNSLPRPLEFEIRNKYRDEFKNIVMSRWDEDHILSNGSTQIVPTGRFMQEGAPDLLSLKMISGSSKGLQDINSIMLAATTAKALFGNQEAVNKMIKMDNEINLKVTGVYEDLPKNTSFGNVKFLSTWDLTISRNEWMQRARETWTNQSFVMYVQINDRTTFEKASRRIKNAIQDNVPREEKKFNHQVFLFPMEQWHLYPEWKDGVNVGGRIQYVWMFGIIGGFVLLLACINFMNLSTARSEKRAREVGVRKAIGSVRSQLIYQFLTKSLLVVIIAFLFAVLFVILSLPAFNQLSDKEIRMVWGESYFWLGSFTFITLTSLIAGSYPAFYLSSFKPIKVLKGTFQTGKYSTIPRKILVVVQFTISVALVIGTVIVYKQIQHAKNRPVGYDKNGLLMIQVKSADLLSKIDVLSDELKRKGLVTDVASSSSPLTAIWDNNGGFTWKNKPSHKEDGFGTIYTTFNYGKTVNWKVVAGRDFSRSIASDSLDGRGIETNIYNIIVNEASVKYMELENPVGEIIKNGNQQLRIIGVVKDMVNESPYDPVRHVLYLVNYKQALNWINIRIDPKLPLSDAVEGVRKTFKEVVPLVPFDYKFADTEYAAKFESEERVGELSSVFATLAIFISCLGLSGLASFVAEKRTKEIGIRKVLGASRFNLWKMLSTEFVVLVFISSLIAVPLSFYVLNNWLKSYEYRTEMTWWMFALAIGGAIAVTIVTVSFQALKAGGANPVKSLRSE